MANEMLLLLDNHIEFAAKQIDDRVIKSNNVFIEALDGPVAKFVLVQLNKFASPYVADELKPNIHEALDAVVLGEYPEAVSNAIELLEQLVQEADKLSPMVKEVTVALLELVKAALLSLMENKEEEGEA